MSSWFKYFVNVFRFLLLIFWISLRKYVSNFTGGSSGGQTGTSISTTGKKFAPFDCLLIIVYIEFYYICTRHNFAGKCFTVFNVIIALLKNQVSICFAGDISKTLKMFKLYENAGQFRLSSLCFNMVKKG
jgi:hypothetical protein